MNDTPKPVLLLIALHLNSMLPMLVLFWRVRALAGVAQRQPGVVRVHRWLSRRSLLLMSWWENSSSAEAWLAHPACQKMLRYAEAHPKIRLRVEMYETLPVGTNWQR